MDFKGAKKYILDRLESELNPNLHYHGVHHTIDVYEASIRISEMEDLSQEEKVIVNTAALYHDAGFLCEFKNNEAVGARLARFVLAKYGYNSIQIENIVDIILSTKSTILPTTKYEKIMSDADYDYLGRNDVNEIADTLRRELYEYGFKYSAEAWNEKQLNFLAKHSYYTASSLELRRPKKLAYYEQLKGLKF